jgi:hypothetical protein
VQSLEWKVESEENIFHFPLSTFHYQLLVLFVHSMAAAATAKLFKLKPVRRVLFVFCRHVVTLFALGALQNYVISRHKSSVVEQTFQSVQ